MSKKSNDSRIIDWGNHYESRGFEADFSNIIIPKYDDKVWRSVLMPAHQELSLNATLAMARQNYAVTTYVQDDDLDEEIIHNARSRTIGSYVILVRIGMEPDPEYLDKSTNTADPFGMIGMNVRERLILGDKVFAETGKHVDAIGWTRCTGSRGFHGSVPDMFWSDDEVHVYWCYPDFSGARDGLREAVT